MIKKVFTKMTTSITDFKKNPNEIVSQASGEPFAVLTNNRPSFYVVSPEVFELAAEAIEEAAWQVAVTPEVISAMKQNDNFVSIDLDETD